MNTALYKLLFIIIFSLSYNVFKSQNTCDTALPMCLGNNFGENVPSVIDGDWAEYGPDYHCLQTTPYPSWFYLKVDNGGNLYFDLSQYSNINQTGISRDIDFIVWGPFTKPTCGEELNFSKIVDCSYSSSHIERVKILNASPGEYYMILITNYSKKSGYYNFIFDEVASTGNFDCSIMKEKSYKKCDDNKDGQEIFDLLSIKSNIRNGDPDLQIDLFLSAQDAQNSNAINIINTNEYTVTTNNTQYIYARVKKNNTIIYVVKIELTVNTSPIVNLGPDKVICQGDAVTLDAGNNGASYIWSNGETTQTISVNTPGNYSVTVTDANGCVNSDEVTVSVNPGITVNLGPDKVICQGDAVTLDAGNNGASYIWSNGETTQTISVNTPGNYSVTVTDANGCVNSDEVTVSVNPGITVNLGPDKVICQGDAVTLDAGNNGASYIWSNGETTQTISVNTPGNYSVTVTDANGCVNSDEVTVSVNPGITVNLGPDKVICQGDAVTLDAGNNGASYIWSNGETTQTISVNTPGNYSVTVTDANGCVNSDEVTVSVNPGITVNLGPDKVICQGDAVTLDAGNNGASYIWSNGETTQTISVNTPGNYSVTVTDANGCVNSDEVTVSVNPGITVNLGPDKVICQGDAVTLDAGNNGASYIWSNGETTQTISVNTPGNYSVTVTDANGCVNSDEVTVSVNPGITVNLGPDKVICQGDAVTLDAGNNGASYIWSNGETTQTISVNTPGNYSVTVTDANGCVNSDEVTVSVNPGITVNLGPDKVICQGDAVTLDAGNNGASYIWSNGETTQTISVNTPGNYSVTVTDANGCVNSDEVTVSVNPGITVNLGPDKVICQGDAVTLDAGNNGASYIWSNGETTQTISVNTPGNYSVTVTDANGCVNSDEVTVSVNPGITVNLGPDKVICQGDAVTLDAGNNGASYIWSNGETTQTISVNTPGNYSVTVTDANGCVNSDEVTVSVNPGITVNLGPDKVICQGDAVTLDAGNNGASYIWSNGETTQTISVNTPGNYSVTVTDANGCVNSDEVTVSVNPGITVNLGPDKVICQGDAVTLDAGNNGASYIWSNGETTQTISVNTPGNYSVTVTDANGCVNSDEVTVSVNPGITVNLGPDKVICQGDAVTLDAGNNGASYIWSNGETTQTISVNTPGNYSVTVTDANGCVNSDEVTVSVNPGITVNLGPDKVICQGDAVTLDAGNNGASYIWSNGETTQTISVNTPGNYSVTVTDANGCVNSDEVTVSVNPGITVNLGPDKVICQGDAVTLDAGNNGASYIWSNGETTQTISVNTPGNYSVTVTDANGCVNSDEVTVSVNPGITVNLGPDKVICQGDAVTLDAGNNGASYIWSNGETTQTISVNTPGNYSVTVTDANGCVNSDEVTVSVNPGITVNLGPDKVICQGDAVTLDAGNNGASYIWSNGETTQTISVNTPGNYSVTVTDANGCVNSDEVTVSVNPGITVNLGPDKVICQGDAVTLDAGNNGASYIWSNGETTQTISVNTPGNYSVTVTDANGCVNSDEVTVSVNPGITVNLGPDKVICQGDAVTLDAGNNGASYIWSNGETTQTISVNTPGNYSVTVTDANGCVNSDEVTVSVNPGITVNLGPDKVICQGDAVTLDAGNNGASYIWSNGETTQTISVNTPGNYSVTVTDANGCVNSDEVTVSVNPGITVNLGPDKVICQGDAVTLDAGNNGASYIWSNGETTQTISVNTPGNYSVTVTDANGCVNSDEVTVSVNPGITVNLGPDKVICQGDAVTLDAGNNGASYIWSNGETTQTISVNTPGNYSVTVTDANGCVNSDEVTVSVNPGITVNLGPDKVICQGDAVTLDAGNNGASYIWSNGETTQTISVNTPGNYSVTVTDANGCVNSDEVTVSVNPGITVNLGPDKVICQGDAVTLDAGNNGASYIWSNGETTQTISVNTPGNYSVTVTDANGCVNSDEVTVSVNPGITVNLGPDKVICQGDAVTLDAGNNGASYIWSNGETTQTISVNTPGNYSVTVTDANGCVNSDEVTVSVNPGITVNLGPDKVICQGDAVTLDAGNNGASYIWSNGETTQTISVNTPGNYSVTVTDANGCVNSDEVTVSVNPGITVNLGPDKVICQGDAVTLDAGNNGASYIWSNGETTQTISVNTPGNYSVTVTDANGCVNSDEVTVSVNPGITVNLGPDKVICQGDAVTLDAGNNGASYIWSNGETTQTISVNTPGNYSVTVTDANGCVNSDEVTVSVNPGITVNLGPDKVICQGDAVTLDAGNNGASYIWSNGETTQTISVNTPGNYSVTVTDANGCVNSDEVTVSVNPGITVNLGPDKVICQGDAVTLDAGNNGASYIWSNGETTQTISVNTPGNYSVTVTDANGCVNSDEVTVSVNPGITVNLGPDKVICQGDAVTLDAGNNGASYIWSNGETTQTISVNTPGNYSVTVTDANGCVNSDEVTVSVNPGITVNLGPDKVICQGDAVTLDAGNNGASYIWSNGETTQTISVNTPGNYSVTVTDANGCVNSDEVTVSVNPGITVNLGPDKVICQGDAVTLDAGNNGASYIWSNGETTQTISVNTPGNYSVTVTDANGCVNSDEVTVSVNPIPIVIEIKTKDTTAEIIASGISPLEYSLDLIQWQTSPIFTNLKPGMFSVYVRNIYHNCLSEFYPFSILILPNIITPNGDGINDAWNLNGLELHSGIKIKIFNRYGKILIDKTFTQNPVWDGKYLGEPVASGSYWYIIEFSNGKKQTGWIAVRNYDNSYR